MENAAKALTIAAGVLIGVIIITIAVYLFTTLGNTTSEVYSKVEQEKIDKFNNQFLKYDGLANCTAHDIVSIANLAKNNNEYYELTEGSGYNYYVNVNVIGQKNNLERESEEYYTNFIENNSTIRIAEEGQKEETKIKCFKCTNIKISDITSRVYEIDFEYENK